MTIVKIGDKVRVNKSLEIESLGYVYEGETGIVIDVTCPYYALVKARYEAFWIDMEHLTIIDEIND